MVRLTGEHVLLEITDIRPQVVSVYVTLEEARDLFGQLGTVLQEVEPHEDVTPSVRDLDPAVLTADGPKAPKPRKKKAGA